MQRKTRILGLFLVLLMGLLVRLLLAPFTYHPYDFSVWRYAGESLIAGHTPYTSAYVYLPLWAYVLGMVSFILHLLHDPPVEFIRLAFKAPIIVADLLVALLLYRAAEDRGQNGLLPLAAWFLNPFVIFVSAIWSMFDSLPTLFTLLAWERLKRKDLRIAATSLGLGLSAKQYTVVLLPVFLLLVLRWEGIRRTVLFGLIVLGVPLLLSLPYLASDPNTFARQVLFYHAGRDPDGATIWVVLRLLSKLGLPAPYQFSVLSFAIMLAMMFLVYRQAWHGSKCPDILVLASVLLFLGTSKVVNAQYQVWLLGTMALVNRTSIHFGVFTMLALATLLPSPISMFFQPLPALNMALRSLDWLNPEISLSGLAYYVLQGVVASTLFLVSGLRCLRLEG